jgi:Peptidase family S41
MKLTRSLLFNGVAAACLATLAAHANAAGAGRKPCSLSPAGGDVVSQSADALSVTLDSAHPAALANWDVRWWNRHRVWITLTAENRSDAPAYLLAQALVDARPDGGAATVLAGPPLTLEPHARVSDRLSIYVPDDSRTLGLRLLGGSLAGGVAGSFTLECSESRYDVGERALAAAPLMDEAMRTYFNGFVDPLPDPRAAYEESRKLGSGAQDAADVVWTLRALMQSLRDVHGYAVGPGEAPPPRRAMVTRPAEFEWRPDGTATVRLHGVDTEDDTAATAWASALHDGVAALAARHPRAWIVDLRDHDAERPWPAFAGLSALLDGPAIGAFVSRAGTQPWIADRGVARVAGGPALVDLQSSPEPSFHGPVAVLLGPGTRNGGEDLAVAFHGRPHTRFFGHPSAGFPSAGVVVHQLSDGGLLGVLEARAVDRTGVVHRQALAPHDLMSEAERGLSLPQAVQAWLDDERARPTDGR